MFQRISAIIVVALVAGCAFAEDQPRPSATDARLGACDEYKYQVVVGYDHVFTNGFFTGDVGMNGWNTSLTGNVWRFLDVTGDIGTYYSHGRSVRSYMGGPSLGVTFLHGSRGFIHGLAGISTFPDPINVRFSMAFGGGIDVPFRQHLTLRVIQADYYRASFGPAGAAARYARIGFGVGYRFGERAVR